MDLKINENSLIQIFLDIDDFCQDYEKWQVNHPDKQVSKWTSGFFRSEAIEKLK